MKPKKKSYVGYASPFWHNFFNYNNYLECGYKVSELVTPSIYKTKDAFLDSDKKLSKKVRITIEEVK